MYPFFKTASVMFILMITFSSCASIVSKSSYPLAINSNPPGAAISITNKTGKEIYRGNTPAGVRLKANTGFFSKAEYVVSFSLDGYQPRAVPVNFKLDGWYWGNILVGGLIGMLIIDPATGAMWKIESEFMNEKLTPLTTSISEPQFKVMNINEVPAEWQEHLERIN